MGRFTLYDFQYVRLKLRHYRCYHDVERKAIEIYGAQIKSKEQDAKSVKRET